MRFSISVLASLLMWVGAAGNPTFAQTGSDLYTQLEEAVSTQQWFLAIRIVQQLQQLSPERGAELKRYEQELERLAMQPEGATPVSAPAVVSVTQPAQPESSPPFASLVTIEKAEGEVSKTRTETRSGSESQFRVGSNCLTPQNRSINATYRVSLPQEYTISVWFTGPTGLPTQPIQARMTVSGIGSVGFNKTVLMGSAARTVAKMKLSIDQISAPRYILVQIQDGEEKSFPLDLPSAGTVLFEGVDRRKDQAGRSSC